MKKILIVIFIATLSSCANKNKNPIEIGRDYAVSQYNDEGEVLYCDDCYTSWKMMFLDSVNAEIWSIQPTDNAIIKDKSCLTEAKYSYDENTRSIHIESIHGSHASACLKKFIGTWTWKQGKYDYWNFWSDTYKDIGFGITAIPNDCYSIDGIKRRDCEEYKF